MYSPFRANINHKKWRKTRFFPYISTVLLLSIPFIHRFTAELRYRFNLSTMHLIFIDFGVCCLCKMYICIRIWAWYAWFGMGLQFLFCHSFAIAKSLFVLVNVDECWWMGHIKHIEIDFSKRKIGRMENRIADCSCGTHICRMAATTIKSISIEEKKEIHIQSETIQRLKSVCISIFQLWFVKINRHIPIEDCLFCCTTDFSTMCSVISIVNTVHMVNEWKGENACEVWRGVRCSCCKCSNIDGKNQQLLPGSTLFCYHS